MLKLFILFFLIAIFYLRLKRILNNNFLKIQGVYNAIMAEHAKLSQRHAKLKEENSSLERIADQTIELYDISKEICKYLDEEKIFTTFREQLTRYINVSECRFLKGDANLSDFVQHTIFPLKIKKDQPATGYLVASGIKEEEMEKFNILANQFILGVKRAILYKRVQEMAITDSLTGVLSRRYFLERFAEELERSRKFKYCFSFLMLDIDYFKDYNDRFGHLVGDTILKEVTKTIKDNIRQIDLLGRFGGEEFCVVLTETDKEEALFVAERIRAALENKNIKAYDEDIRVTISIGMAVFPGDAQVFEQIIEKADQLLYKAKQLGRNKTCSS